MKRGVLLGIVIITALLIVASYADAAGKGLLSIKCDESSAETRFIADQRGTENRTRHLFCNT